MDASTVRLRKTQMRAEASIVDMPRSSTIVLFVMVADVMSGSMDSALILDDRSGCLSHEW